VVIVLEINKAAYNATLFFTPFNIVNGLSTLKNKCYIIAGPNGAGKTTFANEFLPIEAECLNFINDIQNFG
jgi:ABC-type branched-subunit amino acid transport system ATPase component